MTSGVADGSVPKIAEDCLVKGGKWLRKNGEAVYGATDPVKKLPKWLMNDPVKHTERSIYIHIAKPDAACEYTVSWTTDWTAD